MNKKRTIFIGDIHGCYKEFKALLKKLSITSDDQIFLTGDIISKGPKSYKVLKYVYENQKQIKVVKGNNEVDFLNYTKGIKSQVDKKYEKLFKKLKIKNELFLIDYISNFPLYIETNDFLLVHAGINTNKKLKDNSEFELTNIRSIDTKLWYTTYNGKKKIIYGHNAIDGLQIREKTIGIDSGCVYGKSLTAYILETKEVVTQNALDIYINVYEKESEERY